MSLEFNFQEMGNISDVKGGKRLPKGHNLIKNPNSHPYIKVKDMTENKSLNLTEDFEYIENETFDIISQYIVNKDDLIISIVGTIGLTNLIDNSLDNANLTENCAKITNLKKGYNIEYIYYFLNSDLGQNLIQEATVGAVQKKLPIKNIRSLNIPFPTIEIQNKIVKILSDIDKKIAINQKINNNLEAVLENIYKKWFIFYYIYDKSNGMKKDENFGEIPKTWNVEMLKDHVDFVTGVEPGSKNYYETKCDGCIPFIRVGDLGSRDNLVYIEKDKSNDKILNFEDIVLSLDATVGIVKMGLEGAYSTGMRKLVIKDDAINQAFLYCLVKSNRIQNIIATFATGTTILHAGKSINHMNFVLPDKESMDKFDEIGQPILNKILDNQKEIERLSNLRDILLPKLMSGEIDVSEIEI